MKALEVHFNLNVLMTIFLFTVKPAFCTVLVNITFSLRLVCMTHLVLSRSGRSALEFGVDVPLLPFHDPQVGFLWPTSCFAYLTHAHHLHPDSNGLCEKPCWKPLQM